jgi:hypothetical protein
MQNPDNTVEWGLWYTSSNDRAMDFLKYFADEESKFSEGKEVVFTPHFVSWACTGCDDKFKRDECVSDGKYCAMNHLGGDYVKGKDIIYEDLR